MCGHASNRSAQGVALRFIDFVRVSVRVILSRLERLDPASPRCAIARVRDECPDKVRLDEPRRRLERVRWVLCDPSHSGASRQRALETGVELFKVATNDGDRDLCFLVCGHRISRVCRTNIKARWERSVRALDRRLQSASHHCLCLYDVVCAKRERTGEVRHSGIGERDQSSTTFRVRRRKRSDWADEFGSGHDKCRR